MHSYDYSPRGDEPTQQLVPVRPPRQPWWRNTTVLAIGIPFLAALLAVTIGFIVLKPSGASNNADPGNTVPFGTSTATATADPSPTASPTPTPTPTPATSTSTPAPVKTSHPVPTAPPTQAPPPAELPPAPKPPVETTPGCQPTKDGTDAPFSDVRAALAAAGAKHYWQGVVKPEGYTGDGTDISVPTKLMNAVAWQESGWQSAIVACDGGVGTMQIMAGTIDQLNLRFGTDYSTPLSLQENTEVGANYLEWLIMYFGLFYFGGNYDVFVKAPIASDGSDLELRDAVIAAYNVGPGALENSDNTLSVPNWDYVNAVEHFMDSCPCDAL